MTPKWMPLVVDGAYSDRVLDLTRDASGAYAVREKKNHRVVYVGESHTGRLRSTMLRHFHAAESFKKDRRPAHGAASFATNHPENYEVAIHVTSHGKRPKSRADERAMKAQADWIASLDPVKNKDDGLVAEPFEQAEEEDTWGDLLNPPKTLTALGRLTSITAKGRARHWALRTAPILAYDENKRLRVLYPGKVVRPSTKAESAEYRRTHWGQRGSENVRSAKEASKPMVTCGAATSITYTTKKGDDQEITDYVHPFGEGAPRGKRVVLPILLEHRCSDRHCPQNGAFSLVGGSYTVESRGIVG